jgi:Spy/CpxP family protein refolding chaperone
MKSISLSNLSFVVWCIASLLITTSLAWAGPGGEMGGPFGRDLFSTEHLASELELSDAQRTAVEQLMDDARKQARPYIHQLMEQHKAMRALLESDSFDEAAVRTQAAQGATVMTELAVIHARNVYELRKLLTPAQREKMKDMHGRRHAP